MTRHSHNIRYGSKVSTAKQNLARQLGALAAAGVKTEYIFVDKKSALRDTEPGDRSGVPPE
jgi:hypothetical protein